MSVYCTHCLRTGEIGTPPSEDCSHPGGHNFLPTPQPAGGGPAVTEGLVEAFVGRVIPILDGWLQERNVKPRGKRHEVSASGTATGVNTPPPVPGNPDEVTIGTSTMSRQDFNEANRYFSLFQEAVRVKYPHGGYSVGFNEQRGECVVQGRASSDVFKFQFSPSNIKNHYMCFRVVGNHLDNYLAHIRMGAGVGDYSGMETPPTSGDFVIKYK